MTNSKSWIVVKSKPHQDQIALSNLENQGYEFFQPKFETTRRVKNKFKIVTKPVFPNYIFIAINYSKQNWRKISNTRGISRIIVFGQEVPIIRNELIEELKHRFASNQDSEEIHPVRIGMEAKITNGPFNQFIGKIDQIDNNKRTWILLDFLGTQRRVSINNLDFLQNNNC